MFNLCLLRHNKLYCTLWEDYADIFLKQIDKKEKKIPIVIIQFCRPTTYKGKFSVILLIHGSENCSEIFLYR